MGNEGPKMSSGYVTHLDIRLENSSYERDLPHPNSGNHLFCQMARTADQIVRPCTDVEGLSY